MKKYLHKISNSFRSNNWKLEWLDTALVYIFAKSSNVGWASGAYGVQSFFKAIERTYTEVVDFMCTHQRRNAECVSQLNTLYTLFTRTTAPWSFSWSSRTNRQKHKQSVLRSCGWSCSLNRLLNRLNWYTRAPALIFTFFMFASSRCMVRTFPYSMWYDHIHSIHSFVFVFVSLMTRQKFKRTSLTHWNSFY